jgi:SAM-dependent methyltransferase
MPPVPACPICRHAAGNRRHEAREMMFGRREPFAYGECGGCGLLWLLDAPADFGPYYPPDYYAFGEVRPFHAGLRRTLHRWRVRHAVGGWNPVGAALARLRPVTAPEVGWVRKAGAGPKSRILDVGCGQGHTIHALAEAGFAHVLGVDPYVEADIAYPNGARVLKRELEGVDGPDGPFDLVMCHHTFEHLADPGAVLKQMADRLAPGGTILIRIPLAGSEAWARYGVDWVQLDAPRHLFLHTRRSMAVLEAAAALREAAVEYDATAFGLWGSELYRRDIPLRSLAMAGGTTAWPFTPAEMAAFEAEAAALNARGAGDQAAFYLRRN